MHERVNGAFTIVESAAARQFAGALFYESFREPFPVPAAIRIGETLITREDWRQFVALYAWAGRTQECVGFVNYIRFKNVYLTGGLCVKTGFYRRCPREHFAELKSLGGLAQMLLDASAKRLTDCIAQFGYCGDPKARQVVKRAGYQATSHSYVFVKPVGAADPASLRAAFEGVKAIGPF
jgi:hypothetical protein